MRPHIVSIANGGGGQLTDAPELTDGRNSLPGVLILADPRCRLPYYTYLLQGFEDLGHTVRFRRLDGPVGGGMALLIGTSRIWVDTDDMAGFDEAAYDWADVFGKVNCLEDDVSARSKLCLLGPLFGLRLWTLPVGYLRTVPLAFGGRGLRNAIADVRFQGITRLPLSAYRPAPSNERFVFHGSRAWSGKHDGTNSEREIFVRAVEESGLPHEAWFAEDRISLADYLDKTRRSLVVFNAPAVHGCLGWKLGEYLALSKAIISTDLRRALPVPLRHETEIHYVAAEMGSMAEAVELIDSDVEYRRHLEHNARRWFDENLTPRMVTSRLLERAV
jgi:hypothetical protein